MNLHELRERRAEKLAEAQKLIDNAKDGQLADESRKRVEAIKTEVRGINDSIQAAEFIAEAERQADARTLDGSPDFERECRSPGLFLDAIAASAGIEGRDTGRVREISAELAKRNNVTPKGVMIPTSVFERRVVLSSTTGAGAIGTDHRGDQLVDALRASTIVDRLGATVLSNLRGNVSIPAVDTGFTSAWIAENGALSAVDWDVNSRTLSPKHVGALTEFSRNMVLQSDPSVDQMTTRDAARALASALDSAALVGGGSNQPDGIITRKIAAGSLGTWATPSWSEGLALLHEPETNAVAAGRSGWALHPTVRKKLMGTLVAASTDSRMIMSDPNSLYGEPAFSSPHAAMLGSPSGGAAIYSPAWENLIVGYWSGVDVLANPFESTAYSKGNVQVRCLLTADVAVRNIEAFAACTDMETA